MKEIALWIIGLILALAAGSCVWSRWWRTFPLVPTEKNAPPSLSVYRSDDVARGLFLLGCFAAVYAAFAITRVVTAASSTERGIHFVAWSVGVPLFFAVEYFVLFPKYGDPEKAKEFKGGQDAAKAVWLGVAAVLFAAIKEFK